MAPIPRLRAYQGPALFSYGFRPFFLFGSLYAGLAVLAWLPMFYGELSLSTAFAPRDWHVHEMLYGYLTAVVTGFLLTAVPNWTGRLPLQGRPLIVLLVVWALGRVAVTGSAWIGWLPAAIVDLAFLALVFAATAREIISGKNWRNLKVVVILAVLFTGNLAFHLESHLRGVADYGIRIGVGGMIMLVMLIGGRIIPSFTRNWLVRENPGRLPAPHGHFDTASLVCAGASLAAWVVLPDAAVTGAALIASGLLQGARLLRWAGDRARTDGLVLILHIAYVFVPVGFVLIGLASLDLVPRSAGIHAWTGGAIGAMTLAVMSRSSLGHTGRPLVATAATQVIYGLVIVAAVARICAALHPAYSVWLLEAAGLAWAGAFLGFAAVYWGVLTRPRVKQA